MLTLFRRIRHVPKVRYFTTTTTTTDNETPLTNVSNEEDTFSIEDLPVSKVIFFHLQFFSIVFPTSSFQKQLYRDLFRLAFHIGGHVRILHIITHDKKKVKHITNILETVAKGRSHSRRYSRFVQRERERGRSG